MSILRDRRVWVKVKGSSQRAQPEHAMQVAYFDMVRRYEDRYKVLRSVFAIPNAGRDARSGQRMKLEGARAGVWDVLVDERGISNLDGEEYAAMWLEFKAPGGTLSAAQKAFRDRAEDCRRYTVVSRSWEDAWSVTVDYLGLPKELKPK